MLAGLPRNLINLDIQQYTDVSNYHKKHGGERENRTLYIRTIYGDINLKPQDQLKRRIRYTLELKTESTRTSSNIYLRWTKIEYQNNLNPIALFSTLNKR